MCLSVTGEAGNRRGRSGAELMAVGNTGHSQRRATMRGHRGPPSLGSYRRPLRVSTTVLAPGAQCA